VEWIRWTYWVLIPTTLGFMLLHNLLDLLSKLIRRRPRQETGQVVMRMNLWFRIAHWGIMASFPTLVVTGFALKFPALTLKVITLIHWHALRLALKRVAWHRKADQPQLQREVLNPSSSLTAHTGTERHAH